MHGGRGIKRSTPGWLGLAAGFLLIWVAVTTVCYRAWVHGADHRDFYPRWAGARLALMGVDNIYSESSTHRIQRMLYGHTLSEGQDQQGFAYPGLILPVILPFCLFRNVEIATSLWIGFSFLALILGLRFLLAIPANRPRPEILILVLWPFALLSLFQGQVSAMIFAAFALSYTALQSGRPLLAGILLCLASVKPELAVLPAFALLFIAPKGLKGRVALGGILGSGLLFCLSLPLLGWWVPEWISAIGRYAAYAQVAWLPALLFSIHPVLSVGLIVSIMGILLFLRHEPDALFAASVPAELLLFPQTLPWCLTLLLNPLALAIQRGRTRLILGFLVLAWVCMLSDEGNSWWKWEIGLLSFASLILIFETAIHRRSSRVIA
jgi:hypothetical protein